MKLRSPPSSALSSAEQKQFVGDGKDSDMSKDTNDVLLHSLDKSLSSSLEIKVRGGKKTTTPPRRYRSQAQRHSTNDDGKDEDQAEVTAEDWRKYTPEGDVMDFETYKQYLETNGDWDSLKSGNSKLKHRRSKDSEGANADSTKRSRNKSNSSKKHSRKSTSSSLGGGKNDYLNELKEEGVPIKQWLVVCALFGLAWHQLFRARQFTKASSSGSSKTKPSISTSGSKKKKGKKRAGGKVSSKPKKTGVAGNNNGTRKTKVESSHREVKKDEPVSLQQAVAPLSQTADKESEKENVMETNKQHVQTDVNNTNKSSAIEKVGTEKSSADNKKSQKEGNKDGPNKKKDNAVKATKEKNAKTERKQKDIKKAVKTTTAKSEQMREKPEKKVTQDQTLQLVNAKEEKSIKAEAATSNAAKVTIESMPLEDGVGDKSDQNLDSIVSTPDSISTDGSSSDGGGDYSLGDDEGEWATVGRKEKARTALHSSSSLSTPRNSEAKENVSTKSETRKENVEELPAKEEKTDNVEPKATNTPKTNVGEPSASSPDTQSKKKEQIGKESNASYSETEQSDVAKKPSQEQKLEEEKKINPAPQPTPSEEDITIEQSKAAKKPSKKQQPKREKEPEPALQPAPSEEEDAALARMLQKEEEMAAKAEQVSSSANEEWAEVTTKKRKNKKNQDGNGTNGSKNEN